MADLITSARAKYNLNNRSTSADEDTTVAALVTACSQAIRRWCRREFDSQSFDELHDGNGSAKLILRQFPIISIARVAYDPRTVLQVTNTSSSNQRATVAVGNSGLTLVHQAASTTTTTTAGLTWAANATLTALATAITAVGSGWSASVPDSTYAGWSPADLRSIQGALNAKDAYADLKIHTSALSGYEVDTARGWLLRPTDCFWSGGAHYWRVLYTAGYATVPEDVQEACAQWVAALFWQTKRDPGLQQEAIPSVVFHTPLKSYPPPSVQALLQPYRDHRIMRI